jgi:hypothetical protein
MLLVAHPTSAEEPGLRGQPLEIRQLPPSERQFPLEHRLPEHGVDEGGDRDLLFTAVWLVDTDRAGLRESDQVNARPLVTTAEHPATVILPEYRKREVASTVQSVAEPAATRDHV